MKKNIYDMTNPELEQKKFGLIKTNKILSWSAGACAGLTCIGLVLGLALTINAASKNEDLAKEIGMTFDEYKSEVVEEQITDLQSQVEQGKLSFKDYEVQVEEVQEPTLEEFQTTWTEEQRARHDEIIQQATTATAIATSSGILGISSLLGIAIGGVVTTSKIGDIERESSRRKDVEKEMARRKSFAKTCEEMSKLDDRFDKIHRAGCFSTNLYDFELREKTTQEKVEDFNKTCEALDGLDK